MNARAEQQPVVFVIDDDAGVREARSSLFRSVGLQVLTYAAASEFLKANRRTDRAALCLTSGCRD